MFRPLPPAQHNNIFFNAIQQQNVKNYLAVESATRSKKTVKDNYEKLYYTAKEQNSVLNKATASLERYIEESTRMVDIDVLKAYNALKDFLDSSEIDL